MSEINLSHDVPPSLWRRIVGMGNESYHWSNFGFTFSGPSGSKEMVKNTWYVGLRNQSGL
jgi:hypothetical protein